MVNDYDVVVVGSGGAGFAAALSSALGGASVAILESTPVFGGTTAISGAGMWLPLSRLAKEMGFDDSADDVLAYLKRLAVGNRTEDRLLEAFTKNAPEAFNMLDNDTGLEFDATTQPDYQMHLPGAKEGGRAIWPTIFEGKKRLGELFPLVRDVPHPGGMPGVTFQELADSNWGLGEKGGAWAVLAAQRAEEGVLGKGRALIAALMEACANRDVALVPNTRMVDLVVSESGAVTGVTCVQDGKTVTYNARQGVVLASGGFEWNARLWRELVGVPIDGRLSTPSNRGDALVAALGIGARLGNPSEVWWMPGIYVEGETYDGEPRFRMAAAGKSLPGAIVVNRTGKRFANESMNYNDFGKAQAQFDPHAFDFANHPSWVIFDQAHRDKYPPIAYDADRHQGASWLTQADSIGGLADKLGIDKRGLEEQVLEFNRHADNGEDPLFHRGELAYDRAGKFGDRSLKNPNVRALDQGPFYGYRLNIACLGTKGGPVINQNGQVVDRNDDGIPGLYAAGNVTSAVFGTAYPGGGATIGAGVTFGYIAGRHMTGRS